MTRRLKLYQVDAFTSLVFGGNPAAVCPLEAWLPDDLMQAIAAENNLSETAFFVANGDGYDLRWFTPAAEVDLCGHATLGTAYVISTYLGPGKTGLQFETRSGTLRVARDGDLFTLDFPPLEGQPYDDLDALQAALGRRPQAAWSGMDIMALLDDEASVRGLEPDMARLAALDTRGVIVTAAGDDCDFVSRFFAPLHNIPEDPVTGSAHCALTPFWARRLGKTRMQARQVSARGGALTVEDRGERVLIAGHVAPYMVGTIEV